MELQQVQVLAFLVKDLKARMMLLPQLESLVEKVIPLTSLVLFLDLFLSEGFVVKNEFF